MGQRKLSFVVTFCLFLNLSQYSLAERYLVVEDEQGSVKAVREPEKPKSIEAKTAAPQVSDDLRQVRSDVVETPEVAGPLDDAEASLEDPADKELSVFERRYLESERESEKAALESLLNAEKLSQPAFDVDAIRESDYVDGDELLLEEERQAKGKYFVFIDADGQRRVQYINPELDREAMRRHAESLMPEVSEATVIMNQALDSESGKQGLEFPEGADPLAVAILSRSEEEKDFFTTFTENCCADLPEVRRWDISQDRSYFIEITEADPRYRFTEGASRFVILELPRFDEKYRILVRSFINKFGEDSLRKGVFFPQVITLSEDSVPMRVFTGPVLKYVPETWYKHGYLEGVFEIERGLEERYVLINTTLDLKGQISIIEDDELGSFQLEHQNVGTFEIQALLPFRY